MVEAAGACSTSMEFVESASVSLGGAARPTIALSERGGFEEVIGFGHRFTVIHVRRRGQWCADPFLYRLDDFEAGGEARSTYVDPVTLLDLGGRLGDPVVDLHPTHGACLVCHAPGLENPDGPQPSIDAYWLVLGRIVGGQRRSRRLEIVSAWDECLSSRYVFTRAKRSATPPG